jgi:hypothetical protein
MASFDEMFPNRSDCYFALFRDAVYEHDNTINYVFEAGRFKRRDRVAVVNQVAAMADLLYDILDIFIEILQESPYYFTRFREPEYFL